MTTRRLVLGGVLLAILVAGCGSYYASEHLDGLQYVAEQTGFADRGRHSPAVDGPLAGYQVRGVDSPRVGRAIAGTAGVLTVLVLAGGLTRLLRRRTEAGGDPEPRPDERAGG